MEYGCSVKCVCVKCSSNLHTFTNIRKTKALVRGVLGATTTFTYEPMNASPPPPRGLSQPRGSLRVDSAARLSAAPTPTTAQCRATPSIVPARRLCLS
eukprot:4114233-Prymnesium_polylepis.1